MHALGETLLNHPPFLDLWAHTHINDFWRLSHFNNTLTLGSLALGALLALPLFLISNFIIKKYRQHLLSWIRKTKLVKLIKASRFYKEQKVRDKAKQKEQEAKDKLEQKKKDAAMLCVKRLRKNSKISAFRWRGNTYHPSTIKLLNQYWKMILCNCPL